MGEEGVIGGVRSRYIRSGSRQCGSPECRSGAAPTPGIGGCSPGGGDEGRAVPAAAPASARLAYSAASAASNSSISGRLPV